MAGLKILIVDDDRDLAESLAEYLALDGHDVRLSFTGRGGRDTAINESFDHVLVDVGLPDIDGFEVLREIRAERPQLPIALMSGHSAQDLGPAATRLSATQVIIKPINLEDLTRRLVDGTLGLSPDAGSSGA